MYILHQQLMHRRAATKVYNHDGTYQSLELEIRESLI